MLFVFVVIIILVVFVFSFVGGTLVLFPPVPDQGIPLKFAVYGVEAILVS